VKNFEQGNESWSWEQVKKHRHERRQRSIRWCGGGEIIPQSLRTLTDLVHEFLDLHDVDVAVVSALAVSVTIDAA
jgi:hypothetical protein